MVSLIDLDPRMNDAHIEVGEDLHLEPLQHDKHYTNMGTSLTAANNIMVSHTLIQNVDLYA